MKNTETISIICPTWNNPDYLIPCLRSILTHRASENILKVYVVDNGDRNMVKDYLPKDLLQDIVLIEAGRNLGWEGGLKLGLTKIPEDVEFVMFLNDDTYLPFSSRFWLNKMLQYFLNPKVAAVGPTSNVVMGLQNVFNSAQYSALSVSLLIGFCVLVRRSAFEKVGGIDLELPGGDDFDLSIRFVDAGYKLVIDRSVFVYHHGFKTGERIRGGSNVNGGWNSFEYMEKVNTALIRKHGFKRWQEHVLDINKIEKFDLKFVNDSEGKLIRKIVGKTKGKKVYELGCGGQLTVPKSIGVDLIPLGEFINSIGVKSVAKITADVEQRLPFTDGDIIVARHVLEHMKDPLRTLTHWNLALKKKGRIVIAVPNEDIISSIPMNVEHKHAYTVSFLSSLLQVAGFKKIEAWDSKNGVSFVITGVKI